MIWKAFGPQENRKRWETRTISVEVQYSSRISEDQPKTTQNNKNYRNGGTGIKMTSFMKSRDAAELEVRRVRGTRDGSRLQSPINVMSIMKSERQTKESRPISLAQTIKISSTNK